MITSTLSESLPSIKEYLANKGTTKGIFGLLNIRDRIVKLDGDVNEETVVYPIDAICYFNREDEGLPKEGRKPILLRISSDGGNIDDGFRLIDTIMASNTPVYTFVDGYALSMASVIFVTGEKRFMTQHSNILFHDGAMVLNNSGGKIHDAMDLLLAGSRS